MRAIYRNDLRFLTIPVIPWMARSVILLSAALLFGGCSGKRPLMPTPDVYSLGIMQPWADTLPVELRTADVNLMYVTDRIPVQREDGRLDYGGGRDHSQAIGEAVVNIGGDIGWEALAADARTGDRSKTLNLGITAVTEKTRGPTDSLIYYRADGTEAATVEAARQVQAMKSTTHDLLRDRLAIAPRKEILIFVHGVRTSFDEALYITAELWHFLGREFVPIAYSWPAGHRGLLRGYSYDRESSEFTVFHFKRFLAWLATLPEVEGIHIVAHSRGTDVVFTAIRELTIEARAGGMNPRERFKLRNVVIAAPDINLDVSLQRTEREGTVWAADRWTTYTFKGDKAIGISEWLFGGGRFGKVESEDMRQSFNSWMENLADIYPEHRDTVIQYEGRVGGTVGHTYFRTNPAVASDLILTVRFGRAPGAENGRPLEHLGRFFWKIDDDYLRPPNNP